MKAETVFRLSARDFGFVVARSLALVAWYHATVHIVVGVATMIRLRSEFHLGDFGWLIIATQYVLGLGLAYLGQRLWVEAGRFGVDRPDEVSETAPSGGILLKGFTTALGVYYSTYAVATLIRFLIAVVAPGPAVLRPQVPALELERSVVHTIFAIGLLTWSYRIHRVNTARPAQDF